MKNSFLDKNPQKRTLCRVEKVQVGGKQYENANRVDSFIWHLRVTISNLIEELLI